VVGANGKGATATVTWCGCSRGDFFEGCEERREDRLGTPTSFRFGRDSLGTRDRETRRTPGPAAGCNKPATSERRKPSSWRETRKTEREFESGPLGSEACGDARGSGRSDGVSVEGRRGAARGRTVLRTSARANPKRGRSERSDPGDTVELRRGAKTRGSARRSPREGVNDGAWSSKNLEGPSGNGQGQGGSGKPTARYDGPAGVQPATLIGGGTLQALKVR